MVTRRSDTEDVAEMANQLCRGVTRRYTPAGHFDTVVDQPSSARP